nr:HNH endonuclease signature motif containing protein [Armatimonas sp.]
MSTTYISVALRRQVIALANRHCEYCLVHADDAAFEHEVDHIVAEKHRGLTVLANLACACFACNRSKGSDLGSVAKSTEALTRFFHPRQDQWADHFQIQGAEIIPLTEIGEVTAFILGFNTPVRIEERMLLIALGTWPPLSKLP